MKFHQQTTNSRARQNGIVLPVVLIILVIMMLLGVTVIRNVTLEEKMAGNSRDQQLAFQAAEEALRFCENETRSVGVRFFDAQPHIPIGTEAVDPRNWEVAANWNNAIFTTTVPLKAGVDDVWAARSQCMVEKLLVFSPDVA